MGSYKGPTTEKVIGGLSVILSPSTWLYCFPNSPLYSPIFFLMGFQRFWGNLRVRRGNNVLDQLLLLSFKGAKSFTKWALHTTWVVWIWKIFVVPWSKDLESTYATSSTDVKLNTRSKRSVAWNITKHPMTNYRNYMLQFSPLFPLHDLIKRIFIFHLRGHLSVQGFR